MDRTAIIDEVLERAATYPAGEALNWAVGADPMADWEDVAARCPEEAY